MDPSHTDIPTYNVRTHEHNTTQQVFRHGHEVMEGRTSSVARHTLGFLPDGEVANYRRVDAPGALR